MATVEQNIIDKIIQVALIKINGEGDYHHKVELSDIYDGYVPPHKLKSKVSICVVDESQTKFSPRDAEGNQYVSGGKPNNMHDGWPIEIYGYVKPDAGENMAQELRKLQTDIFRAMLSDRTQGGTAWDTTFLGYVKDNNVSKHSNIGEVIDVFSIKYQLEV